MGLCNWVSLDHRVVQKGVSEHGVVRLCQTTLPQANSGELQRMQQAQTERESLQQQVEALTFAQQESAQEVQDLHRERDHLQEQVK